MIADIGFREDELTISSAHGFGQMRYVELGERDNGRVVICVHGLTRSGRDFDALAAELTRADDARRCADRTGRRIPTRLSRLGATGPAVESPHDVR